jgi:hypothetical protein
VPEGHYYFQFEEASAPKPAGEHRNEGLTSIAKMEMTVQVVAS